MACFVLVHGAFHGGWVWSRVAARLRAAGHDVLTPTLTGCGDRFHLLTRDVGLATHVDDLVATLASSRAALPAAEAAAAARLMPDLQPLLASADMQEGLRAFVGRRPGAFTGK